MHEISGSEIPKVKVVAELKYLRSSFTFHVDYKEIGFIRLSQKKAFTTLTFSHRYYQMLFRFSLLQAGLLSSHKWFAFLLECKRNDLPFFSPLLLFVFFVCVLHVGNYITDYCYSSA